jgi:catechol 2,3-dioxygenase-like lactoylglutathione lyase family enzyme
MMLNILRRPSKKFHVNPRVRAYGKARLDIASRVQSPSDWERLWKRPAYPYPFTWGAYWKQCIEYKVDDFAAEVGFYTDILGLAVNALDPGYAMFTSPGGDFYIAIVPATEGTECTPPDAIRIQFMVADVFATAGELERRGISLEQWPKPCADGSSLLVGFFRTPHGICVDLWGMVETENNSDSELDKELPATPDSVAQEISEEQEVDEEESIEDEDTLQAESSSTLIDQINAEEQAVLNEPEEMLEIEYVDEEGI